MKKNIVILTAGVGNGHKTAAFGIKKNLETQHNIQNIEIIDITETYFAGKIIKYVFDNSSFWFLEKIYTLTNKPNFSWFDKLFINICFYNLNKKLKNISTINNHNHIDNLEIYVTFPMLQLLNICFEKNVKTIIQLTDFYTPHFSWAWNSKNCSEIRVLDTHSKKYLLNNMHNLQNVNILIHQDKITVSEFPLILNTQTPQTIQTTQNREEKTILCFFHNVLLGNEEEILQKIQNSSQYKNYKILILAGKNYTKIQNFLCVRNNRNNKKNTFEILHWVDTAKMTEYYDTSEIVAGKCGGAFIAEVVKLQKKIIITGVFSVQEEGNFEYMHKYHKNLIVEI